jgi:thiosulfate reductase cytochrome b subunit
MVIRCTLVRARTHPAPTRHDSVRCVGEVINVENVFHALVFKYPYCIHDEAVGWVQLFKSFSPHEVAMWIVTSNVLVYVKLGR